MLGDWIIDYAKRQVTFAGRSMQLTATEYRLLYELSIHAGQALSRAHLMSRVWSARLTA